MVDTRFIETDALVYAMEKNEKDSKEKLRELTSWERKKLQAALVRLDDWIEEVNSEVREEPHETT